MSDDCKVPQELVALQRRFTGLLRSPLSTATGRFEADTGTYDNALVAAVVGGERAGPSERLAVYQRQYWLRLFNTMQAEFPLTARLVGMYRFNLASQRYLLEHPPTADDLARVAQHFAPWWCAASFVEAPGGLPHVALEQALAVDGAWRQIWLAVATPRWQPNVTEAQQLAQARLRPAPTWALVEERWPLVALRQQVVADPSREHLALPPSLSSPSHWLLVRNEGGVAHLRLQPLQAQLYRACASAPLRDAVADLEARCAPEKQAELPALVRSWLAQSVELGLWSGTYA